MPNRSRNPIESTVDAGSCRPASTQSGCSLGNIGPVKFTHVASDLHGARPMVHLLDDDKSLLRAYQCFLEQSGFDVRLFSHGGEYLESVRQQSDASAAVVDLRLGEEDIDGLMVLQQLREWHYLYPVILLTGYGDAETSRRAYSADCYVFLQKPIAPADLVEQLKVATRKYRTGELR